jgi:hypothetical protein
VTRFDCREALLDRLAQNLEDIAAELWQFTQEEHAVMRHRHLTQHGDMPAPNQLHIRDHVVGGGKGTGRDEGSAVAGGAGDAMDECGFNLDCAHAWGSAASAAHNAP